MALHKNITPTDNHVVHSFVYADAAARGAASGFASTDIGRVALQQSDNTLWALVGYSPVTWAALGIAPGSTPVPATRQVIAGTNMSGGGNLTADVTLNAATQTGALVFAANSVGTTTTTRYLPFGYDNNIAGISPVGCVSPRAGTLKNLRVRHCLTGTGGAIVYTLRVNGVDTALTCSATAGSAGATDIVHTVAISAGDVLDLKVTKAAGITLSPTDITATIEFGA
jgi:hypothetical protein